MASKKRVFISVDYDHDEDTKIMFAGQAEHDDSPFDFTEASAKASRDSKREASAPVARSFV
jgi:hypothetical protein